MTAVPGQPNIIILMTDQQRTLQHFPEQWIRQHLPNLCFFLDNGVVFEENICNTSPCGPSRASMFSGLYPAVTGATENNNTLQPEELYFARILEQAGYDVFYKGKLHMVDEFAQFSTAWPGSLATAPMIARQEDRQLAEQYGLKGWTSPDFGTALVEGDPTDGELATLGGGSGYNDSRIVTGEHMLYPEQESALQFLKRVQDNKPEKPFCLVVSLVNPHDISLFPEGYKEAGYENAIFESFEDFPLPNSYYNDDLSTKPQAQACYRDGNDPLKGTDPLNYVKFYAYLHTLSDRLLQTVFDAIGAELQQNTIVIRMADHGEMGMAHGGMKEKIFNFYNETCKIPMIWYHPQWFGKGRRQQLVSMIDLVPTFAAITKTDISGYSPMPQGTSFEPLLFDASAPFVDVVLFCFNNAPIPVALVPQQPQYFANSYLAGAQLYNPQKQQPIPTVVAPGNIYGIHTGTNMKYAVYFNLLAYEDATGNTTKYIDWNTAQFEMYDLNIDPDELINLLPVGVPVTQLTGEGPTQWEQLHTLLTQVLNTNGIAPTGWGDTLVPPIPAPSNKLKP